MRQFDQTELAKVIDAAWEARADVSAATKGEVRDAVAHSLALLDSGEARVALQRPGLVQPWRLRSGGDGVLDGVVVALLVQRHEPVEVVP